MFVDDYFLNLETSILACNHIRTHVITKDKRSDYIGYFKADIYFSNNSHLHIREFVFTRSEIIKDMYVYHYQDAEDQLIFRYDNTRHFPNLPNFPHHKHVPPEVHPTPEPNLQKVLTEILALL